MANEEKPAKAVDVAKTGKVAPDSSSRPIVVTNRSVIKDPMVKDDMAKSEEEAAHKELKLQPTSPAQTTQPSDQSSPDDSAPKEEAKEPADNPPNTGSDKATVDAVVEQAGANKDAAKAKAEEAEKAKNNEITKLVESKKYFLPIGQITKRRHNRVAAIVVILLLLPIAAYLLIDMEFVEVPFELPYQFFK